MSKWPPPERSPALATIFSRPFFLSWLATEQTVRRKRILVSIGGDMKIKLLEQLQKLEAQGWEIYATEGTNDFLCQHGIASRCVYKASEKIEPNVTTLIAGRKIDLIVNIPRSRGMDHKTDGFSIRRLSIDHHIPLITNLQAAQVFLQCLAELKIDQLPILSLKEFTATKGTFLI